MGVNRVRHVAGGDIPPELFEPRLFGETVVEPEFRFRAGFTVSADNPVLHQIGDFVAQQNRN